MNVDVVVDAGNSFIKWGRCAGGKVVEMLALDPADPDAWKNQLNSWALKKRCQWVISGSDLARRDRITVWLKKQGQQVSTLALNEQIPITVNVRQPEKVGLDRLCNALAACSRKAHGSAAIVIDAGTAITVDYVDEACIFQGGAILPGLWIMAELLHKYTAALPLIKPDEFKQLISKAAYPGKETSEAMALGINACFLGGVERVAREYLKMSSKPPMIFIGGGDGPRIGHISSLGDQYLWPEMTLEGIRIAAER